jgi:adenylate cyclase
MSNTPKILNATTYDTRSVVDWLMSGARSARESERAVAEACERLCACGIPLWQVDVFVRTLHPDITGLRFHWQAGSDVSISVSTYDHPRAEVRNSFVESVCADGVVVRRQLFRDECRKEFPFLQQLHDEGATDLFATPLVFTEGDIHAALWTTRQPGGFTDEQIAAIETVVDPLARVAEVRALRRTATNLLDTYCGTRSGKRILAGDIRRGHSEVINAAIWLSDMRGFTTLSDRLPAETMIDLLNRYFDCQVPVILDNGGEVLNFMGDGLLAMFPIEHPEESTEVCNQALAAALETRTRVLSLPSLNGIEKPVSFGLALHLGDVLYGNIGGGNRLDFTCIGPAVNLSARLEKVAAKLARTIVSSEEFASHCASSLVPLGQFALRGFGELKAVFGLPDEKTTE